MVGIMTNYQKSTGAWIGLEFKLENLLRSSVLDEWQRQLTKSMLLRKIKILIQGAKKRSNTSTYNKYLEKQKYWEAE